MFIFKSCISLHFPYLLPLTFHKCSYVAPPLRNTGFIHGHQASSSDHPERRCTAFSHPVYKFQEENAFYIYTVPRCGWGSSLGLKRTSFLKGISKQDVGGCEDLAFLRSRQLESLCNLTTKFWEYLLCSCQ